MTTFLRLTLAMTVSLAAACKSGDGSSHQPSEPSPAPSARAVPDPWTPQRVVEFVVETDEILLNKRGELSRAHRDPPEIGQCYGGPAYDQGEISVLLPVLEARLTGKALACYQATYFGCRLGDRIARAGTSLDAPVALAFIESKAQIVEQTADKVVADVPEAEFNMVDHGKLDKAQARGLTDRIRSRYTLIRDAKGVWRISDRVPSYPEWECREK